MLKAITGGDSISAERKGRDRFDYRPWAVPVFSNATPNMNPPVAVAMATRPKLTRLIRMIFVPPIGYCLQGCR